jgi:GT2 family glycosyltransferase
VNRYPQKMLSDRKDVRKGVPVRRNRMLSFAVHFDAACLSPRRWIIAMWWRVLGKRLRARARLAPLLAASPRAYRLWLARKGGAQVCPSATPLETVRIFAIVAAGNGREATLCSLLAQDITILAPELEGETPDILTACGSEDIWLLSLEAGDVLAPGAADTYRAALTQIADKGSHSSVIYADDDLLDAGGQRITPHFKPAWNPELFRHFDYLTGACIVHIRRGNITRTGRWNDQVAQILACAITHATPLHLPQVLHHRRTRPKPRRPSAPDCVQAWLDQVKSTGETPLVSVIVPTRNRVDLLRTCIAGLERTEYPALEVIVVDNGSDDPETLAYLAALDKARYRVLRDPGPFNFSRLNNRAARVARGELLCLLNNDIEVRDGKWLAIMVRQALRPEVGAVGAQLLYPDGRIQHAGVVLGICGGAAHAHRLLRPEDAGYHSRHLLPQFVSAVTAACLVVTRDRFEAVGGFDETNFAVAFNDVDLCMRLNANGWQAFYEPRACLIHHESVSRGFDRDPVSAARFAGEFAALDQAWRTQSIVDPNHHVSLSPFSEQFVLDL